MKGHSGILDKCREKGTEIVLIGTSAGGVEALKKILPAFRTPSSLSVLVVIHLPSKGPNLIPLLLQRDCEFKIKEAESCEVILPQTIYMAPPDYHLSLESDRSLSLSVEDPCNFSRPSIDILFKSGAQALNEKVLGILLTGANSDGASGLRYIQDNQGLCIVEDPSHAQFNVMPQAGLQSVTPDAIMSLDSLREFILQLSLEEQTHAK